MIKTLILILITYLTLNAVEIPTQHATMHSFGSSVTLNAKIIQLSNAKQSIMSAVGGHIEAYYVKAGQSVKKGDKIVLIESITISKMTAEYIAQKKQLASQLKNYTATKQLYDKGVTSMQELNAQSIKKDALLATLTALKSQLNTLGIDTKNLTKATSNYILYAHSDGIVSAILQPLHSSIKEETPILSLVKSEAYYLQSFLPLKYGDHIKIGQKIVLQHNGKNITSHITQILPKVDERTQRIIVLSSIDASAERLYLNAYTQATLYFDTTQQYIGITKSALSFFNNEWVVFIPKHEEEEHHEEEDHEDEEHHELPYEVRIVKIITQNEDYVAIEGLHVNEEYVSDNSYYVKSMLLKSSLGEHGH